MASFVEQATLRVNDQSSGAINKINAALRKLQATAKSLKSTTVNINVNQRGLQQATAAIMRLSQAMRQLQASSRGINLNVHAAALNQAAAAAQRYAAAMQRAQRAQIAAARGGGPRGPTAAATAAAAGGAGVGRTAFAVSIGNIAAQAAHAAARRLGHDVVTGTKQLDVGETKLAMLQLNRTMREGVKGVTISDEDKDLLSRFGGDANKAAQFLIRSITADKSALQGGGFLNVGQRTALYAETFGTTATLTGAKQLNMAIEELIQSGVALGQSFDEANDKAYAYAKAADMMGRLTYQSDTLDALGRLHEKGTFRKEGATEAEIASAKRRGIAAPDVGMENFFEYMQKLQPEIGREMTGPFIQGLAKYLGGSRFGISNRALGATALLGEEMGTRAAVGYRQAVKQLSGIEQTNDRIMNMINLGLIPLYHKSGKKYIADQVVDEALLKQDLPQYIAKNIAAGAEGERDRRGFLTDKTSLLAKAEQLFKRPFDIRFPEEAQALASKLVGNSTAIDTLTNYMYNAAEIQRKLNVVEARSGKPEDIRKAQQESLVVTMTRLENQFQGAAGQMVKGFAPAFQPLLEDLNVGLTKMQQTFAERRAKGEAPITALEGASVALMTPLIGKTISTLTPIMGSLAGPFGYYAGISGMMSTNPAVRTLSAAGVTLLSAGQALQSAAAAQQKSVLGEGLDWAWRVGAGLGGAGLLYKEGFFDKDPEIKALMEERAAALKNKALKEQELSQLQTKIVEQGTRSEAEIQRMNRMARERGFPTQAELIANAARLQGDIARIATEIQRLENEILAPRKIKPEPLPEVQPPVRTFNVDELVPGRINIPSNFKSLTYPGERFPLPRADPRRKMQPPLPRERPTEAAAIRFLPEQLTNTLRDLLAGRGPVVGGEGAPLISPLMDAVNAAKTQMETLSQSQITFSNAISGLPETASKFAATFEEAGPALAAAGQQAVDAMQAGASGVGSAIGSAFVAVASTATVNVNYSGPGGGGVDRGGQSTGGVNTG